jgi:hypothetical protein
MHDDSFDILGALLDDPLPFERFVTLSEALIQRGPPPPWLARAYYLTLVAGAISREDFEHSPQRGREAAALLEASLQAERLLGDDSGVEAETTVRQLLPAPGYAAQYTLAQVSRTLERFAELVDQGADDPARALLEDPDTATVTRSIPCLWYASALLDLSDSGMGFATKVAPIQTYNSALAWTAIGATPMGVPGPYYGNWAFPSPQPSVDPARLRGTKGGRS